MKTNPSTFLRLKSVWVFIIVPASSLTILHCVQYTNKWNEHYLNTAFTNWTGSNFEVLFVLQLSFIVIKVFTVAVFVTFLRQAYSTKKCWFLTHTLAAAQHPCFFLWSTKNLDQCSVVYSNWCFFVDILIYMYLISFCALGNLGFLNGPN